MTDEYNRTQFLQRRCEQCGRNTHGEEAYIKDLDECWCHPCADEYEAAKYDPAGRWEGWPEPPK